MVEVDGQWVAPCAHCATPIHSSFGFVWFHQDGHRRCPDAGYWAKENRPTQPTSTDRKLVTRQELERSFARLLDVDELRAAVLTFRYWLVRVHGHVSTDIEHRSPIKAR